MRIILYSLTALAISGGVASADRVHTQPNHTGSHGPVVRDHRGGGERGGGGGDRPTDNRRGGGETRDHRGEGRDRQVAPVRGGEHRGYDRGYDRDRGNDRGRGADRDRGYERARPVARERYVDYRVRPQVIVENYEDQAGYVWVAGDWQWNGAEWIWAAGHYAPVDVGGDSY